MTRVVLVRDGNAEHRHDRIADELLDPTRMPLDDRLHPLEVTREDPTESLGIEPLAERSRLDHVREQNGDRLPHLVRRWTHERSSAARAESGGVRAFEPAARTQDHASSLRR
jgi:hypothetical protein